MGGKTWHAEQVDPHAPVATANSCTTERPASATPMILSYSSAHGQAYNGVKRRSRHGCKAWDEHAKPPKHGSPPPLQPRRPVRAMGALLVLASPSDHPQSDHTWQANTT